MIAHERSSRWHSGLAAAYPRSALARALPPHAAETHWRVAAETARAAAIGTCVWAQYLRERRQLLGTFGSAYLGRHARHNPRQGHALLRAPLSGLKAGNAGPRADRRAAMPACAALASTGRVEGDDLAAHRGPLEASGPVTASTAVTVHTRRSCMSGPQCISSRRLRSCRCPSSHRVHSRRVRGRCNFCSPCRMRQSHRRWRRT